MNNQWTDDRVKELRDLIELLGRAKSINQSSGVIQNLEICITIANNLTDFASEKVTFIDFLSNLAIEDRTRRSINPKTSQSLR